MYTIGVLVRIQFVDVASKNRELSFAEYYITLLFKVQYLLYYLRAVVVSILEGH